MNNDVVVEADQCEDGHLGPLHVEGDEVTCAACDLTKSRRAWIALFGDAPTPRGAWGKQ